MIVERPVATKPLEEVALLPFIKTSLFAGIALLRLLSLSHGEFVEAEWLRPSLKSHSDFSPGIQINAHTKDPDQIRVFVDQGSLICDRPTTTLFLG